MHPRTGITGRNRRTTAGRCLLFHINTGLFWIYGVLTFGLAFSVAGIWLQSIATRALLSFPISGLAAFTMPRLVQALFWNRFRDVWMDNYFIAIFLVAILFAGYAGDIRDGRHDALDRLAVHAAGWIAGVLASILARLRRERRGSALGSPDRRAYPARPVQRHF